MTSLSRAEQRAATRVRILDAAVQLLADHGINGVRIAAVAAQAGVSSGLVHYHFGTRKELLADAFHHAYGYAADRGSGGEVGATVAERIVWRLERILPLPGHQEKEWAIWIELWVRALRDPELQAVAIQVYATIRAALVALLREGVQRGEFVVANPERVVDRLVALNDGFGLRATIGDPEVPISLVRAEMRALLESELGIELPLPSIQIDHVPGRE